MRRRFEGGSAAGTACSLGTSDADESCDCRWFDVPLLGIVSCGKYLAVRFAEIPKQMWGGKERSPVEMLSFSLRQRRRGNYASFPAKRVGKLLKQRTPYPGLPRRSPSSVRSKSRVTCRSLPDISPVRHPGIGSCALNTWAMPDVGRRVGMRRRLSRERRLLCPIRSKFPPPTSTHHHLQI